MRAGMYEQDQPDDGLFVSDFVTVRSIFVRGRNCLLLQADFAPLFVGYYLHLMQHAIHPDRDKADAFKQLLAFFTLFLVSRPWNEQHAWTINVKLPENTNYFVAGSSFSHDVVGRIFTKDVRQNDITLLYAQNICRGRDTHTSVVPLKGSSPREWAEEFFRISEQRQARAFVGQGDFFYLVTAEPDADFDWLNELTAEQVAHLEATEETKLLETRNFTFHCGCNAQLIIPVVRAMQKDFADILSEQGQLDVSCPRCGVNYTITREMMRGHDTSPDAC